MDYIDIAINEAKKAYEKGEIPVGAVIVKNNKIVSKAHNLREQSKNVLAHAEILAIEKAAKKLQDWRLNGCDMYVTLKPCGMCEKIINESRISNVFYLTEKLNFKKEYSKTSIKLLTDFENSKSDDYVAILQSFFQNKR